MALSDAVSAVGAVFRTRPADLLPLYLLGASISAIVRVVPFAGAILAAIYLETTGRFDAAEAALADLETDVPDSEADPEVFEAWALEVSGALEPLVPLPIAVLVAVTGIVSVVLLVVLLAIVSAAQLTACDARLRDERGLIAGIAGVRRYGLGFLILYLLEIVLWITVLAVVAIPTVLLAVVLAAATPVLSVFVVLFGLLVAFVTLAVVRALFAFAPVALVVDDVGVVASLSNTLGFVRARPGSALFYWFIALMTLAAVSIVSSILVLVEVTMAVSLVTVFIVLPALDLLKTALYAGGRGLLSPPAVPDRSLTSQFRGGIRRGWDEMVAFVWATPLTHGLVVILGVGSFIGGWLLVEPYLEVLPEASISARIEGMIPPTAALEFFGNNWLVAITTAFSGIALIVPAVASLLFNGVAIGATARLEVEPLELLAFVIPHGIFEIPAIFIASALGIWLGLEWMGTYFGGGKREAFADSIERAFWVLVGVGILLAVAGFVEGFISPYYWRPFL